MKTIVTKSRYAELKERTPSCISNWITEGKITKSALVGDGVRAKIWVEQADADLVRALDPSQQASQVRPIEIPSASPTTIPQLREGSSEDDDDPTVDGEVLRRTRLAKAEQAEEQAEALRRRNALDEGRWLDAEQAKKAWAATLARVKNDFQVFLESTLAREIAEKHNLDWKALSVEIKGHFRLHCEGVVDEAKQNRVEREAAMKEAAE